jgi:hypothetical protein
MIINYIDFLGSLFLVVSRNKNELSLENNNLRSEMSIGTER